MGVSKTGDHMQIKIKIPNPSQEPPASSKAQNEDLKDMDVLCTFKIKIESQNSDHWYIKDQWPYPDQDQDAKSQSVTSSILQRGHKGRGCSLDLQNQDREPKLRTWFYLRPVTISRSRSRSKTAARNLPNPPNPQSPKIGLKGHGYSFHPQTKMVTISKLWSRCKTPIWDKLNPL